MPYNTFIESEINTIDNLTGKGWMRELARLTASESFFECVPAPSPGPFNTATTLVIVPRNFHLLTQKELDIDPIALEIIEKSYEVAVNRILDYPEYKKIDLERWKNLPRNDKTIVELQDSLNSANREFFAQRGDSILIRWMKEIFNWAPMMEQYGIQFVEWSNVQRTR